MLPDVVCGPGAVRASEKTDHLSLVAGTDEFALLSGLSPHWRSADDSYWHVHVDLALNKRRAGDAAGIAMGREVGQWVESGNDGLGVTYERVVRQFEIPLAAQILAPTGDQIYIGGITQLILQLKALRGFNITSFSFDGFQSAAQMQELALAGLVTAGMRIEEDGSVTGLPKPFSVDRNDMGWRETLEAANERRLWLPKYELLKKELRELEGTSPGHAPDHPIGGCFTGDTRVPTLDGTFPTMAELAGREAWVYSARPDGSIVPGRARGRMTKEVRELLDVVLDSGAVVRCTPEHLWMLRDGSYREARDLLPGVHRLMPLNQQWPRNGGYEFVSGATGAAGRRATHHVVYEALYGPIPLGYEVHHRNEIKTDNSPENLEALPRGEHKRGHAQRRHAEDPSWRAKLAEGTAEFNRLPSTRDKRRGNQNAANHRVRAIIPVALPEPVLVYDLEVDEWSNFALAAGVFVHNSKDVADPVAGVVGYLTAFGHAALANPLVGEVFGREDLGLEPESDYLRVEDGYDWDFDPMGASGSVGSFGVE